MYWYYWTELTSPVHWPHTNSNLHISVTEAVVLHDVTSPAEHKQWLETVVTLFTKTTFMVEFESHFLRLYYKILQKYLPFLPSLSFFFDMVLIFIIKNINSQIEFSSYLTML